MDEESFCKKSKCDSLPSRSLASFINIQTLTSACPFVCTLTPPHHLVIETAIRDALKVVLQHLSIPSEDHGFHAFPRSGATWASDNGVSLDNIKAHGLWRSSMVWVYLKNANLTSSAVPRIFDSTIPDHF